MYVGHVYVVVLTLDCAIAWPSVQWRPDTSTFIRSFISEVSVSSVIAIHLREI